MTVPLSLSSVPATLPYIQYVATNGQTVFPYPFPITQDADLVVIVNGVTLPTGSGYTLSGEGNPTGGNLTFTVGQTVGAIVTLFRNITIERLTQFGQNSGFSSEAFNFEFNNVYLIMQQLEEAIAFCLQVPNTNNPSPTTTLTPTAYANKYLAFDANGNPFPALLTSSGTLTQAIIGSLLYPQTAAEAAAAVVPTSFFYVPGDVRRYGAVGGGATDDLAAFNKALSSNVIVTGPALTYRLSAGITVSQHSALDGGYASAPDQTGIPYGFVLKFDNAVSPCVTISASGNNSPAALRNAAVWRTGSPPAGSIGVFSSQTQGIDFEGVTVCNHAIGYKLLSFTQGGIWASFVDCNISDISDKYIYLDGWPETRMTNCRLGRNGSGELVGTAYFYITASHSDAGGPNSVTATNCQFNQGTSGPSYFCLYDAFTPAGGGGYQYWEFVGCHIENVSTAYFASTSTGRFVQRLMVSTCGFNSVKPLFYDATNLVPGLNPSTSFSQSSITNSFIAGDITLAPTVLLNSFRLNNSVIVGAVSLTGPAALQNNAIIDNCQIAGALTLAGTWADLRVNSLVNGAVTTSGLKQFAVGSPIVIDVPGTYVRHGQAQVIDYRSYNTVAAAQIQFRNARGSAGAETISSASDQSGQMRGFLYDGAAYQPIAAIRYINSGGAPAANNIPGGIVFSCNLGSTTLSDVASFDGAGFLYPLTDNAYQCGKTGLRWSSVWAANGTIQTSDARDKTDVQKTELGLSFILKLNPVSYKFKEGGRKVIRQEYLDANGKVIPEGEPVPDDATPGEIISEPFAGKRTHFGLLAQEVAEVAKACGAKDFGGWILTDPSNPDSSQGLRYDQFISPMIKAVQELAARIDALEKH